MGNCPEKEKTAQGVCILYLNLELSKKIPALVLEVAYGIGVMQFEATVDKYITFLL